MNRDPPKNAAESPLRQRIRGPSSYFQLSCRTMTVSVDAVRWCTYAADVLTLGSVDDNRTNESDVEGLRDEEKR
jgi:hypothetical protein